MTRTVLVVGASGATGKHLVTQLLESGQQLKEIVRSRNIIPSEWLKEKRLLVLERHVSEIILEEMSEFIADCQAVSSCLGHHLTWKGIYGKPRKLVTDTVNLICQAILNNASHKQVEFVLMSTAANINYAKNESVSLRQHVVLGLIQSFPPPHAANEDAAEYLRKEIGAHPSNIEWVVVRPDSLLHKDHTSDYSLRKSLIRGAISNAGQTSRVNVAHFMASLLLEDTLWKNGGIDASNL